MAVEFATVKPLDRRTALMALAALPGVGPVLLRRLDRLTQGRIECLFELPDAALRAMCPPALCAALADWRLHYNPQRVLAALQAMPADWVTCEESGFPAALTPFPDCPVGLYRYRSGAALAERAIAIVGTRKPSNYGRKVAAELTAGLVAHGFDIVSGMAEGIDTIAHESALAEGGRTAAFLGCGLKRPYPQSNRGLMERIAASAGVWTEFPLWRCADRRSFPQRNRIVAGVSHAVVVVESGITGGSLITARMAAEQGRPVYVVPGRIDAAESAGCHALIRDGAQLITCVADILEDLAVVPQPMRPCAISSCRQPPPSSSSPPPSSPAQPAEPAFEGAQALLWDQLRGGEWAHPDQLAARLQLPFADLRHALLEMELGGWIARRLDGRYERS